MELLEDERDADMRADAIRLVTSSAEQALARIQFMRIAFGAAGSAGALVDMGEAGEIAKAFVGDEKVKLEWNAPRENRPKQQVKLVLNMMLMAMAGIPRGGLVTVTVEGDTFTARAAGDRAKVPEQISGVLAGTTELTALDARLVQPYYAKQLARSAGLSLSMDMDEADVVVKAA